MLVPLMMLAMTAADPAWPQVAPSGLPPVTVRWEDPGQQDVVIVEGARYQCRIATLPARLLTLRVDGKDLLGPGGMDLVVVDAEGRRLAPAPPDIKPDWKVWRGQNWQTATSARARMNVWSASPYYHDCHILDIPLLAEEEVARYRAPAGPPLRVFDLTSDHAGFTPLQSVTFSRAPDGALRVALTGEDPFFGLPPVDVPGPVRVTLRMRSANGGGAAVYWAAQGESGITGAKVVPFAVSGDGEWHDYEVTLDDPGRITTLRIDPPGESGTVDIARIELRRPAGGSGLPRPARGELVFHAQPDRLAIEARVDPAEGRPAPKTLLFRLDGVPAPVPLAGSRPLATLGAGSGGAVLLGPPRSRWSGGELRAPPSGQRPGAWLVMRPATKETPAARMAGDLHPLHAPATSAEDGHWQGYDPIAGYYIADQSGNMAAFSFDAAFHNPTRRLQMALALRNDRLPREMLVKVRTGVGNLETAVLTDPYGFMLPVAAFVSKNFGGEREEPDDTAFGDIYFPLRLAAGEIKRFRVEPLIHGWGIWPLKQVSSIRFFIIYWHCSTGASESTCWTMDWLRAKGSIYAIPDFRPMSGPFWAGQPQHDVQHFPGWLQYNDTRGRLCYERTEFDSIAPSMARFTMFYHTSDHTARARVEAFEAPQRDEMRTMMRLRYDWDKPCVIEGDARRNFRWLNMNHFRFRNDLLLWTGPDGKTQRRTIPPKEDFVLLGEPMAAESPFMASEGSGDKYGVLTLVTRFRARLGGKTYNLPALSAAFDAKDASTWLTVPETALQLQPGDYLEAEVMLMPHGEQSPPGFKAERERRRFGLQPVRITVSAGQKLADYPPQVRAKDDVAAFHLEGGHGDLPLLIEGMRGWKTPLLWTNGVWQDHQTHGGDGYQVQPDGAGGYRVTFMAPHRDGQTFDFLVTRAACTGDIARVFDRNGRVEMRAAKPGRWQLKAPALFGPGINHVDPKQPVITFQGEGAAVRQLPLGVAASRGPVDLTVEAWQPDRIALRASGPAEITLGDLRPGGRYRVTVGGKTQNRRADGGSLRITLARAGTLEVAPLPE